MGPHLLFTFAVDPRRVLRAFRDWRWNRKGRRLTRRAQARIGAWSAQQQRLGESASAGLGRPPAPAADECAAPLG
jgi:hypothetical protein